MKYYVIADVHGFYDLMISALQDKGYFEDESPHKLIICGDLFDRGSQAKELERFVLDLMQKDEVIFIRGNHEDLIQDFLNMIGYYVWRGLAHTHHFSNGTVQTVLALTGTSLELLNANPELVVKKMEETEFIKSIIPAMQDYYETEHYIFVHGWIPCSVIGYGGCVRNYFYMQEWRDAPRLEWMEARWYNGMEAARQGAVEPDKTIVCGHWNCSYGHAVFEGKGHQYEDDAVHTPYYADGIIAIDAATGISKMVNCIVLEDEPLK